MNTSKLKKFAQATRRKLIGLVSARLDYVLKADSAELRGMEKQVEDTRQLMESLGREELIEKVAYTWFNRFMALRFMDVNDYHTFRVRVVSPVEGNSQPEILEQAKAGSVDDELKLDRSALDQEISAGEDNKALRRLIVAVCNRYFDVMPFMFEKVSDYTELLMPEDLLSESSVVAEVVEAMGAEDCVDVEVIGWLYQFYISEKKDEVFAALKKNVKITPQNIPAATQLFTPHWIVRYMVENSLGRLWLLNKPGSGLKQHMKYFVETEPEKEFLKVGSVEEIKLCDPACGSGHILVYAFDLLTKNYEEEGYDSGEIPRLILEKNLFGIDIDDRAAALASFALVMKGRGYYRRFFRKGVLPTVISMQNVVFDEGEIENYVREVGDNLMTVGLRETLGQFDQAKNFGSLIKPEVVDVENVKVALAQKDFDGQMFSSAYETHGKVLKVLEMVEYLAPRYHCVVANPPYMGGKGMNEAMQMEAKHNFSKSKTDLFSMFIEQNICLTRRRGYIGMITLPSWLFLTSFEDLRTLIVNESTILSLLHMGRGVFGIDWGSTSFILQKGKCLEYKGIYFRLHERNFQHLNVEDISKLFKNTLENHDYKYKFDKYRDGDGISEIIPESNEKGSAIYFEINQKEFFSIPGTPLIYWASEPVRNLFKNLSPMSKVGHPCSGIQTGDNEKHLRFWHEVNFKDINFNCTQDEFLNSLSNKWLPHKKGGGLRKWYGNDEYVMNWTNKGRDICNSPSARPQNLSYMCREGVTWSHTSSRMFSCRLLEDNFTFNVEAPSYFSEDSRFTLGYLCSSLARELMSLLNPTLHFLVGTVKDLPIPNKIEFNDETIKTLIAIYKDDWNSYETSWFFCESQLLKCANRENSLNDAYETYRLLCKETTNRAKVLEEENNEFFANTLDLKNDASLSVSLNEITLMHNPHFRYGSINSEDDLESLFLSDNIIDMVSYSVGCMLGRYSLDKPGLILANQGETLQDYLAQIPNPTFLPDDDNIIPIVDGDYFEDDIVARFKEFLRVSFGPEHYQENLKFIEDAIGKDLRKYFLKDFYKDHIKRYKKRPIYWMFSSPKGSFNCLIYMHRYRPDTVSRIVSNYLQEYIHKLNGTIQTLESDLISADASASAKTKATKEIDRIKKMLKELQDYERDIMLHLAQQKIEIDLDDGVKQNYPKFGKSLAKVVGLS